MATLVTETKALRLAASKGGNPNEQANARQFFWEAISERPDSAQLLLTVGERSVDFELDERVTHLEKQLETLSTLLAEKQREISDLVRSHAVKEFGHKRVAELESRIAELDAALMELQRTPQPDSKGNVSYETFMIALLKKLKWRTQDAHKIYARFANIKQQTMTHWRERDTVPYHYYELLERFKFRHAPRPTTVKWGERELALLNELFARRPMLDDLQVAQQMSEELGLYVTDHAVHNKAQRLGLLRKRQDSRSAYRIERI